MENVAEKILTTYTEVESYKNRITFEQKVDLYLDELNKVRIPILQLTEIVNDLYSYLNENYDENYEEILKNKELIKLTKDFYETIIDYFKEKSLSKHLTETIESAEMALSNLEELYSDLIVSEELSKDFELQKLTKKVFK